MSELVEHWTEVIETAREAQRAARDCDSAREEEERSPGTCDPAKRLAAEAAYASARERLLTLVADLGTPSPTLPPIVAPEEARERREDPEPWALTHSST